MRAIINNRSLEILFYAVYCIESKACLQKSKHFFRCVTENDLKSY
jgi:hypothetical protein